MLQDEKKAKEAEAVATDPKKEQPSQKRVKTTPAKIKAKRAKAAKARAKVEEKPKEATEAAAAAPVDATEAAAPPAEKKPRAKVKGGQNGPSITLTDTKLNDKEARVLKAFQGLDEGETASLAEIADACWPKEPKKANSWVRNSLRRLVRGSMIEKTERGTYRLAKKRK